MAQGTIGLRFNVDVSNSPAQVENLTRSVASLNEELAKATEERDWKSVAMLTKSMEDATSARGRIMQQASQAQNAGGHQSVFQNSPLNQMMGGQLGWMFQQMSSQLVHGILSSFDTALSAAKMRASGDYTGASVAYEKGMGGLAGGGVGSGIGLTAGIAATVLSGGTLAPLIPILTSLGNEIGKFAGEYGSKEKEVALAYSAQYKGALPSIDALNQNFGGDITRKSLEENNDAGMDMYDLAKTAARDTGLSVKDFIGVMAKTGAYGIQDKTEAANMARMDALLARRTGAGIDRIQNVSGAFSRYAGDDNASEIAYAGLKAQGMANGQFNEYLTSMERILKEGISQGFVRGADEIAGNMALLHKLSGDNPLWQGEQGAQRLSQMNNAIANATKLQSVEDVISFGVARDWFREIDESTPGDFGLGDEVAVGENKIKYTGTYIDEMQIMERGFSAELLRGQWNRIKELDGENNTDSHIERLKTMHNMNYTGAVALWDMLRKADEEGWKTPDIEAKRKAIFENKEYKSDSAKIANILNDMDTNGVKIGKIDFDTTEITMLREEASKLVEILDDKRKVTVPVLPIPGGEPIDMSPSMAGHLPNNTNLFSAEYWRQRVHPELATRDFLMQDRQANALINAAAQQRDMPLESIIDEVMNGRYRFDSFFQELLDTSEVGHDVGMIDEKEYPRAIDTLIESLKEYGATTTALKQAAERLLNMELNIESP